MLRLLVNKAKHHYNSALEHAERGRDDEAIVELKNAIELDQTLVNAHVVLGTLYLKKEQFEEARACWDRALALDHRYAKAHDYLIKSARAEYVFPVVARLRKACLGLALLTGLLVIGVAGYTVTRAMQHSIRNLAAELKDTPLDSAKAESILEKFADDKRLDPRERELADLLRAHINESWREQLDLASAALNSGAPLLALDVARDLGRKQPNPATMGSVQRLCELANRQSVEALRDVIAGLKQGAVEFEAFASQAQLVLKRMPQSEEREALMGLVGRTRAEYAERLLAEADRAAEAAPIEHRLDRYVTIKQRYPSLADMLAPAVETRLLGWTTATLHLAERHLATGELESARTLLTHITQVYRQANYPLPQDLLAPLEAQLIAAERAQRLTAARQAFKKKQWDAFLAATEHPAELTTDTAVIKELAEQREAAQAHWTSAEWEWLEGLHSRFAKGTLTEEQAQRVLAHQERLQAHLTKELESARGMLRFYEAVARFKLGQLDETRRLLDEVRTQYAGDPVMKALQSFERRFQKELAPPPAADPSTTATHKVQPSADQPTSGSATE